MAKQPSRSEPKTLVEESEEEEQAGPSSPSRRQAHYGQQRTGPPSRPDTGEASGSASCPKAKGRRESYQEPEDFKNLTEVAAPEPATRVEKPFPLEQAESVRPQTTSGEDAVRKGPSGTQTNHPQAGEGLTETAIPPPKQPSITVTSGTERSKPTDKSGGDYADSDSLSAPAPFVQRTPDYMEPNKDVNKPVSKWLSQVYTVSYLIFFAILGTLARLGVQWLTFYPGTPIVTPVIWANFGGSLIMGFLAEDQGLFRDHWAATLEEKREGDPADESERVKLIKAETSKTKKAIPLYIGLATGFCGSFTSFSSFARDAFLGLSNNLPTPINHPNTFLSGDVATTSTVNRDGGYSFEAWAAVVIATIALSLGGLIVGAHLAIFLTLTPISPRVPLIFTRRVLDPAMVLLGWGCWFGAVFLCIWPPDRPGGPSSRESWSNETWRGEVLFALAFAPVGCLVRFYASLKMNSLVPAFPLGTFAVNMLGTAIEGMCYDIQHVGVGVMGRVGGGRTGCQVLQGVQDGYCGCLTTVSTWVAEINGLRTRHGYTYALSSVVGALCLMVVIMGSVKWSVGWSEPVCNTGYPDKIHG
jgi:fluoride exporter